MLPVLKMSATLSTDALACVALRWPIRTRRSIASARTGGVRSIGSEETSSPRCVVACIDIFLTDFDNHSVLQIHDIGMENTSRSESRGKMSLAVVDWHKHFPSKMIEPRWRKTRTESEAW